MPEGHPTKPPKQPDQVGKLQEAARRLGQLGPLANIKFPGLGIPRFDYPLPDFSKVTIPTPEDRHRFESAAVLLQHLARTIRQWRGQLPENAQPVIIAVLSNGASIRVNQLREQGHNGILVTGQLLLDEGPVDCFVLTHQANLQLLCHAEQVESPKERHPIGFRYDGQDHEE